MKSKDVIKKVAVSLVIITMTCFVQIAVLHAQTDSKELLEKYSTCQPVKPEDNKIGLAIESISKETGNSFLIQWTSTSDLIMKNPRGHQLVAVFLNFIDPDDTKNMKIGFASQFRGNLGNLDKMVVTLDKPAKFLIIYFEGISSAIANTEELRTVPLFFMAELGDQPKLLEKTPRYASDLFQKIVEENKKKDTN